MEVTLVEALLVYCSILLTIIVIALLEPHRGSFIQLWQKFQRNYLKLEEFSQRFEADSTAFSQGNQPPHLLELLRSPEEALTACALARLGAEGVAGSDEVSSYVSPKGILHSAPELNLAEMTATATPALTPSVIPGSIPVAGSDGAAEATAASCAPIGGSAGCPRVSWRPSDSSSGGSSTERESSGSRTPTTGCAFGGTLDLETPLLKDIRRRKQRSKKEECLQNE